MIAYVIQFFGTEVYFPARIISSLLGFGTAYCTYLIAKQLYNKRIAWFAVILLFAMRSFNLAQVSSNNDIFVVFFFTLTVLLLLKLKAAENNAFFKRFSWAILAGISLGLGLLSKYTMALAYLMLLPVLYLPFPKRTETSNFLAHFWVSQRSNIGLLFLVVLSSLLLFSVWVGYLFRSGFFEIQTSILLNYVGGDTDPNTVGELPVLDPGYFSSWRIKFTLKALVYSIWSGIGV